MTIGMVDLRVGPIGNGKFLVGIFTGNVDDVGTADELLWLEDVIMFDANLQVTGEFPVYGTLAARTTVAGTDDDVVQAYGAIKLADATAAVNTARNELTVAEREYDKFYGIFG